MGYYINPPAMTKEAWLAANGTVLVGAPVKSVSDGNMAVCLVNNGLFTAAGIAYDDQELEAFRHPDGRHKIWFYVPFNKLLQVNPELASIIGEAA